MILGIGIDMVDVSRISRWLEDRSLMERYFSLLEVDYIRSQGNGAGPSLAARFAAKEAFGKALGSGLKGIVLKDIEVVRGSSGKPDLAVHGTARSAMEQKGGKKIHLSLSHEGSLAIAQVLIEGEDHG